MQKIYRNIISKTNVVLIRKLLQAYNSMQINGGSWAPINDSISSYSYFDNNDESSKVKKIYQQFSFGLWAGEGIEKEIKNLLYPLQVLHASVNGYLIDAKKSSSFPSTGFCSRYTLNHIPVGGGYIDSHTDDKNETQQLQTLLYLTEKPEHYSVGEILIKTPEGIFSDDELEPKCGDVLVFDPGLFHEVTPIDPAKDLIKFDYSSGRVTAVFVNIKTKN
jgi:hypothetical protein